MSDFWPVYLGITVLLLIVAILLLIIYPRQTQKSLKADGASPTEIALSGQESRRLVIEAVGGFALVVSLLLTLESFGNVF